MKKGALVIGLILLLSAGGVGFGFYEYNRHISSLTDVSPSFLVSSEQLLADFEKDEGTANTRYLGKVIQITGRVQSLELGHTGRLTIVIGSGRSNIRCSMDSGYHAAPSGWGNGRVVAIKGLLIGYNRDDMGLIGSDIELSGCVPADGSRPE